MGYKTIFWDYDGVIMDSMPIRTEGFRMLFSDYSDSEEEQLIDYHLENGGLSRYVKIRYFFEKILHINITEEEVFIWAAKYSLLMLKQLKNPDKLIRQTINFIEANHTNYNFHIVSGSDGKELNEICKAIKIDHFFNSISGSPTPKKKLVKEIIEAKKYSPDECILIGDSKNDFEAAEVNSIHFAGFNKESLKGKGEYYIEFFQNFTF
jgi:HAD superfamily hydrolase (TIGR01549 family)